jgi:hypothetical protein
MKNATPQKNRWWILAFAFGGIVAVTLTCGFFYSRYSIRREATLRLDLFAMRQAIQQYTLDRDHSPQSLQDLGQVSVGVSAQWLLGANPQSQLKARWRSIAMDVANEYSSSFKSR